MPADTANLDVLTPAGTVVHRPERHKYGIDIVGDAEVRPIEVVAVPWRLPLPIEIQAVVG